MLLFASSTRLFFYTVEILLVRLLLRTSFPSKRGSLSVFLQLPDHAVAKDFFVSFREIWRVISNLTYHSENNDRSIHADRGSIPLSAFSFIEKHIPDALFSMI